MRNKKAWMRIVEAVIAILIIMGFVLVLVSNQEIKTNVSDEIYEGQVQILDLISEDNVLREDIISEDNTNVNNKISQIIPGNWEFATEICDLSDICTSEDTPHEKDVYVTEMVISSDLSTYQPKKLRFFVWMK